MRGLSFIAFLVLLLLHCLSFIAYLHCHWRVAFDVLHFRRGLVSVNQDSPPACPPSRGLSKRSLSQTVLESAREHLDDELIEKDIKLLQEMQLIYLDYDKVLCPIRM